MVPLTHQQKHIETWQTSGLSQVAYCRQHKLNSKTFSNWLRIYHSQNVAPAAPTLIPIEIKSTVSEWRNRLDFSFQLFNKFRLQR